jgi:uridine kinase
VRGDALVVAIAGASGSGKSTLARDLAAALPELRPVILAQDHYFRDFAELGPEERERARTANHPDAVDWPAFHATLAELRAGRQVTWPAPGTHPSARGEPRRTLGPAGLVLIEGLFALWDERCRESARLRLYTEVPDDERVLRRLHRDLTERGGTIERAVAWYRRDVQPNYPVYTAATRRHADLVVPMQERAPAAVGALAGAIRSLDRPVSDNVGTGGTA